ncbi:MAG TPA: glycosyl hydrolase [Anaerohalosphaeraceae bacterium]|nr:glycosyl hydrolase [Anaerohalosphaeraceae bacterium]
MRKLGLCLGIMLAAVSVAGAVLSEQEFLNPPSWAGVRCWWWWLNSNVTKEAITRDLEEMKAKGFSGAMIFDAGGADQRGNAPVPAGPLFASPAWVELYKHALQEADRLGLEIGLCIQSGWNLGGPIVTPDFAAKHLTWSEMQVEGPQKFRQKLPMPENRNWYRDICVLAFPLKTSASSISFTLQASSCQDGHPVSLIVDRRDDTFWVSAGTRPGEGPSPENPQWIQFTFEQPVAVSGIRLLGRPGYGPKTARLQVDGGRPLAAFSIEDGKSATQEFDKQVGTVFRILFEDAYDTHHPAEPRNVQVAELCLLDEQKKPITHPSARPGIQNLQLKILVEELGMSAPDCRFLLDDIPAVPGEEDTRLEEIVNLTEYLEPDGTLTWTVPAGKWTLLRFGYTPTDARVSTSSGAWQGMVIDYLSADAFDRYWRQVVQPLLEAAGPLKGTVLKQLETDSWECGGMNWSPAFAEDFKKYRGYDPIPYLPVIAGKIVESRDASNAFLADFRKTLGDCVADNHYAVFAEYAHRNNLQIQPESGGPHAGPLDAIKNLGKSDITMSEFWSPSPHRPTPETRFFVKQAASAAHIYGREIVAAESFTTIGRHWNDVLWKTMKPAMDHEFCSGLNQIFFHTFTCSPKEMGIPGQEYFAGTHVNPQVTWWHHSIPFMQYINRCHYVLRQGKFMADVLYYYGDHVPNIARLKEADPPKVLPGYDYDITDEVILQKLTVRDGRILVPGGVSYRLLVMPDHQVLSLEALEKVSELLQQGAVILCPRPERMVSLVGGRKARRRFEQLTDQLWGEISGPAGQRSIGTGRLIWGETARRVLLEDRVKPDFEFTCSDPGAHLDYIHYTLDDADVYFVSNQTESTVTTDCLFRVTGKAPELWDPVTGQIRPAAFRTVESRTQLPLRLSPYGSLFVVFRKPSADAPAAAANYKDYRPVQTVGGSWLVRFDPRWGGPAEILFPRLLDWTEHELPAVRYYSGTARYQKSFHLEVPLRSGCEYWLDLGRVEDVGIAKVTLNGEDLGILWTPPFRAEITSILKNGVNFLEVEVVNSWRNRLIGDRDLPPEQRLTKTNIVVRPDWRLEPSGLLGPVVILEEKTAD